MNNVDINAFKFEYDLTWMSFFQNDEGQTYARYGGREDAGPETHLSKASLIKTMKRVLALHDAKKARPWSKYEPKPDKVFTPEQIPPMKKMIGKRKETCIHCHDVKNATLFDMEDRGLLKKDKIFTYPSPVRLGIVLDPDDQTRVKNIIADSAAAKAGISKGDEVVSVANQPVLTFADFTRVLELAPEAGTIAVRTKSTNGSPKTSKVRLSAGWRRSDDPSWRPSVGAIGPNSGFWANQLPRGNQKKLGLGSNDLSLRVVVVWGDWAKRAGIKRGDVVTEIDGLKGKMSIKQLQAHLQLKHDYGDTVSVTVVRGGKPRELKMKLPASGERH